MSRKLFSLFGELAIAGLDKSNKDLKAFDKTGAKIRTTLNKVRKASLAVGKSITKYVTAPILGASAAVTKFGADFDEAMTNSLAIMGDVSAEMRKDMEMVARSVAKDLNIPAKDAAEAYFFLASAGLDAVESMTALPKVAAFAKAGNFDLATATDLLTDSQSALGLQSENTAEHIENMVMVSDTLVKANTIANASVEQFSESLTNRAGAALRNLNKDVTEGVALLAVYADQGVKGADAGTKLDIVFRDLQKAAVQNKQAFQDAGVAVFDTDGKMRHIADIIQDLTGHLGGMSDEQRRAELMTLGFTDKSVSATAALLGTSDAIRKYEEQLKSAAGTTEEVAQKQLQSFWQQVGLLQKRLVDVGLTLWQGFSPILMDVVIPAIDSVIEKIAEFIEMFQGLPQWVQDSVIAFTGVVAIMGPILLAFAKFLPLVKALIPLYRAWVAGQSLLNVVMSANPIGAVVIGIAALVAAGVVLVKHWDTVKEKFLDVWDWMQEQPVFTFLVLQITLWIKAGEYLMNNWEEIKDKFIEVWDWMQDHPALMALVTPVFALIKAGKFLIENWEAVKKTFLEVWGEIEKLPFIKQAIQRIKNLIAAGQWLIENIDTIGTRFKKAWNSISFHFHGVIDGIQLAYKETILEMIKGIERVGKLIPKVAKGLSNLRKEVEYDIAALQEQNRIRTKDFEDSQTGFSNLINLIKEKAKAEKEANRAARKESKEKREDAKKEAEESKKAVARAKEEEKQRKKKTAEEIAAAKKRAEKRAEFEDKWSDKLFDATKTQREILDKAEKEALEEADKLGADKTAIQAFYAAERVKLAEKEAELKKKIDDKELKEKTALEREWNKKLAGLSMSRVDILEKERDEALRIAKEKGASTLDIEKFYAIKIGETRLKESQETSKKIQASFKGQLFGELRAQLQHTKGLKEQKKIALENAKAAGRDEVLVSQQFNQQIKDSRINSVKAGIEGTVSAISQGVSIINDIWSASLEKRMAEIEEERAARIAEVEASVQTEAEKESAIEVINQEADAKRLELQREQAKREKANSLMSIALSTAMAVASALTIAPPAGIILAGIVGALGLVQLGIAAATPIPFAEGGLVKSDPGRGIIGQIGEGKEDELILPMKTGAAQLADNIMGRITSAGGALAQSAKNVVQEIHNHYHIGTLIGDDASFKMLERKMRPYRVAEAQRRGL